MDIELDDCLIQYVRDEYNRPVATLLACPFYTSKGNIESVSVGYSFCHDADTFSKAWGRKIAYDRAKKWKVPSDIPNKKGRLDRFESSLNKFITRCTKCYKVSRQDISY